MCVLVLITDQMMDMFGSDVASHPTFLSSVHLGTFWARSPGLSGCCREGFSSYWRSSCGWSCFCGQTGSSRPLSWWGHFSLTHSWWTASGARPATWGNPFQELSGAGVDCGVMRWCFPGTVTERVKTSVYNPVLMPFFLVTPNTISLYCCLHLFLKCQEQVSKHYLPTTP